MPSWLIVIMVVGGVILLGVGSLFVAFVGSTAPNSGGLGGSAESLVDIEVENCSDDGASGTITNTTGDTVDVYVEVTFIDMPRNESLGWSNTSVVIRPHGSARFNTWTGTNYRHRGSLECEITDLSVRDR